jgi:hypothetical protein
MGQGLKTNFVLIDFENVQSQDITALGGRPFKIKVFVGANQTKVPLQTASSLQVSGSDAKYVQIDGNGSNALDFHIAYYIGRLAVEHPDAHFHVISKDTGFDPLISHLRRKKISCQRSASVSDIPLVKIANSNTISEKVDAVASNLAKRSTGKPCTEATLRSTIKALFGGKLSEADADAVLGELLGRGVVAINDGKVSYHPAGAPPA